MVVDFELFDADNHYYEAEDAFLRYAGQAARGFVRWVHDGKRRHLLFGTRVATGVPNPTFNPIAQPGAFHQRLKELERGVRDSGASRYGELEPLPEVYRSRDARIAAMDDQGVERILIFPTLALTVEHLMIDRPEMLYPVFHAFNEWLDDDWGFNYRDRIYAPPHIPLYEADDAALELDWALQRGAKVISLRPGPTYGKTQADPYFDPFWARVSESGVLVAYHAVGGPAPLREAFQTLYAKPPVRDAGFIATLEAAVAGLERPMMETAMALIFGNLFGRFPNVQVASIEMGGAWVPYLLHALDHGGGIFERKIEAFGTRMERLPSDVFKERVWVSPFPEEDILALVKVLGVDHVLMGSDWPHPEGTMRPADYVDCLEGLDPVGVRRVMRDNALALVT